MSDRGYCETCYNTGWVDCYCGGDLCICENNGEYECPACGGDFACNEMEDVDYDTAMSREHGPDLTRER